MIERMKVASLSLAASALVSIAVSEGYMPIATSPVEGDLATYGFGTTEGVKAGDKITVERALIKLLDDTNKFENVVKKCANVPMYNYEYNAYVSLTYNIGEKAFCNSTLVKKLKAYDYEGACKEILRWNMFKGSVLPGLDNRRKQEYRMCIGD